MIELLETIMLVCFGLSWPVSLFRTIRAKSSGASASFLCLILAGYFAGITAKLMSSGFTFVACVYIINILMVAINLVFTLIYRRRENKADTKAVKA